MKKFLAILLCAVMVLAFAACTTPEENNGDNTSTEKEYKLGMGIVVSMDSSATENAQVDATVAAVVTDADGKIVACRIDCAQNKMTVTNGAVELEKTFKTKMELGADYGMGGKPYSPDRNGDGIVKEWDEQAKAFEAWVVGKTATEVKAMPTQTQDDGYVIPADEALLTAGCTIQVGDFVDAVVKACGDEQGVSFKSANETFKLGVAAMTTVDAATKAATAEEDGVVAMYTDFAASVVVDGKIVASINDAIQPKIAINAAGEIGEKTYVDTKRCLKEDYGMGGKPYSPDRNGDGVVKEWYEQSAAFSKHVIGMTAAEVSAMPTQTQDDGYVIPADEALLTAGCTIQVTSIKAVVAQSVTNAR